MLLCSIVWLIGCGFRFHGQWQLLGGGLAGLASLIGTIGCCVQAYYKGKLEGRGGMQRTQGPGGNTKSSQGCDRCLKHFGVVLQVIGESCV